MDWRKVFLAFALTPQLHTNTGRYKGAIKMLEEHLDRSILWIMCRIFYAMEALTGQKIWRIKANFVYKNSKLARSSVEYHWNNVSWRRQVDGNRSWYCCLCECSTLFKINSCYKSSKHWYSSDSKPNKSQEYTKVAAALLDSHIRHSWYLKENLVMLSVLNDLSDREKESLCSKILSTDTSVGKQINIPFTIET